MKLPRQLSSRSAFSLLELVIVLALIAALAGVVTVRSGKFIQRGQVSRIIQLASNLKTACATFYADTGAYPREYDMSSYTGTNRELTLTQTIAGWEGPYLEKGITAKVDNPFGSIHLYDTAVANGNSGFDVDGDGAEETTSNCCMLYLTSITQETAEKLEQQFDAGVTGTWTDTGSFKWNSGNQRAFILIFR